MQLKFKVTGQVISRTDTFQIVSGSKYVYTAAFSLPSDYAEFTRIKAFFARAEEELSMELTLNETTGKYESNVDDGLNLITGDYMLYLVGYYDDGNAKRLPAVMLNAIKVISSGEAERDPLGVVDPTYIERMDTLITLTQALSDQAGSEVLDTIKKTLSGAINELKLRLDNSDVASLALDVQANTDSISALDEALAEQAQEIADVAVVAQANTEDIGINTADIGTLQQTVSGHETTLGAYAQAIAANTQAASDNAAGVAANTQNIAANAQQIAVNTHDIADNKEQIENIIGVSVTQESIGDYAQNLVDVPNGVKLDYFIVDGVETANNDNGIVCTDFIAVLPSTEYKFISYNSYHIACEYNSVGTIVKRHNTGNLSVNADGFYYITTQATASFLRVNTYIKNTASTPAYGMIVCKTQKVSVSNYSTVEQAEDFKSSPLSKKTIDLVVFAGQSNMSGQGDYTAGATVLNQGEGYHFRYLDAYNSKDIDFVLRTAQEPFGTKDINTNVTIGLNADTRLGGMVTSIMDQFYKHISIPMVGIPASYTGHAISDFMAASSTYKFHDDILMRVNLAKTWLTDNGYTINHFYLVWCQGETDGDNSMSKDTYKATLLSLWSEYKADMGFEKMFIVRIGNNSNAGNTSGLTNPYASIFLAQTEACKENEDLILASTKLTQMMDRGLMKDQWHYTQPAYNEVGKEAGRNIAFYWNTGKEPIMYDDVYDATYFSKQS